MEAIKAKPDKAKGWVSNLKSAEIRTRNVTADDRARLMNAASIMEQCVDVTLVIGDIKYTITAPYMTVELSGEKD